MTRTDASNPASSQRPSGGLLIWLVLLSLAAIGALVVGVLALSQSPEPVTESANDYSSPTAVTEQDLSAFARENGIVYWAGPMPGVVYELTVSDEGHVFIRYVPEESDVGSNDLNVTSVATYSIADGYELLQVEGDLDGRAAVVAESGALVVTYADDDTRAYFSFADADFQVEVYSPEPGVAEQMVLDGSLVLLR